MDTLQVVTPPASEPVTLAEAKSYLRLEITDDDSLVTSLISAARITVEVLLRQTLVQTVYSLTLDGFPNTSGGYWNRQIRQMGMNPMWLPNGGGIIWLPKPPLVSVASITYLDSTGNTVVMPSGNYTVSTGMGSRVAPVIGQVWPATRPQIGTVVIQYTSGYSSDATSVPETAKLAIKMIVYDTYENRGTSQESGLVVSDTVLSMLAATDHGSYG